MARQGSKCLGTSLNCEQLRKLRDEIGRKRVCVKKVLSLFSCCDSAEQSYSRKTHLALAAFPINQLQHPARVILSFLLKSPSFCFFKVRWFVYLQLQ